MGFAPIGLKTTVETQSGTFSSFAALYHTVQTVKRRHSSLSLDTLHAFYTARDAVLVTIQTHALR